MEKEERKTIPGRRAASRMNGIDWIALYWMEWVGEKADFAGYLGRRGKGLEMQMHRDAQAGRR